MSTGAGTTRHDVSWLQLVHRLVVVGAVGLVLGLLAIGVVGIVTSWSGIAGLFRSFAVAELSIGLSAAVVGTILVARRPDNPLSWVMLLAGVDGVAARAATALGEIESVPAVADLVVDAASLLPQLPPPLMPALVLVLFPDGRPARRWWWWLIAPVVAMGSVAWLGMSLAADPAAFAGPLWEASAGLGALLLLLGVAGLVLRRRDGDAVLRLQVRGVLVAMAVAVPCMFAGFAFGRPDLGNIAWGLVPVSIGVAVSRYRLYELDRLVSRTVSWAVVTVVLVGMYLGAVVVLQTALRPALGDGDLPVALATLVVAAAARPLLLRVRSVVDRRFNRARYDAVQVVEAFGRRVRDEVALETIVAGLRAAANATVQPVAVTVQFVQANDAREG